MMQTSAPVDTPAIDPQQQQWIMMQTPPQSHLQQPKLMLQQNLQQVSSADKNRTLWIGGVQHWMDETYLRYCFASAEGFVSLKIIRNKQTGQSKGYGFLEFVSHAAAQMALQNYNGLQMPNAEEFYRLNWATFGVVEKRPRDYTIFVGDLASDVTDYLLQETFRAMYPSAKGSKVVTDKTSGRSKGYGFVMFGDENEQIRAMTEMNGMLCSSRRMRIGPATRKNTTGYQQPYPKVAASASVSDNTTLFVGCLDSTVTVEMLTQTFVQFGELLHVKILVGKRCGFVRFSNRASADGALQMLQGRVLGERPIRLSWALSPAKKQAQPTRCVQTQQVSSADENRTLWIGGLQHWMDETYLRNCFSSTQDLSLKIIRNKQTGQSAGYGFLEFVSHAAAQMALQNYNGLQMPNAEEFYRLNWATFGVGEKREVYTIFVGDLASDVTDWLLKETFGSIYSSVKGAKVVIDSTTGRSKGYGFVRFRDKNEQFRAMTEMNGKFCSFFPMRIGPATTKKPTGYQQS